MSSMISWCALSAFIWVLPWLTRAYGADVTTTCPPSFIDGVQYSVLCQVNRTAISTAPTGKCLIVYTVVFYLVQSGSLLTAIAYFNYGTCNTTFTGDARCVNTTSDVATYELRFTANNTTQHGRSLRCSSDCLETTPYTVTSDYTTCNPVTIIGKPPPRHNCPKDVVEGQNLICTCNGGIDTPPGVFRWADNSGSESLTLHNVQRTQTGTRYRCQAVWSGGVVEYEDIYTLNVVYGPDNVTATVPDAFDTNGSQIMTLNCFASAVNPSTTFTWTRQGSSDVTHRGQSYTFKPQPPDDDDSVFQCQAKNTVSNFNRSATVIVRLNYPPTTDPAITNNSNDGNLYQGDNVTFTCIVIGGKPVNATSVNFNCSGKQSTGGTAGSNGVSSSVIFNPVSDCDHNTRCTCNTRWKQTDWYTRSVQTTLFVNTPPSPPNIFVTSGDYPPIAGVTIGVSLTCVSSITGRPAVGYTWLVTGGGQIGIDAQGRGTLTFDMMGRENDGQNVTCRANNLYTINRQSVADGSFTLLVYYHPVITLSTHQDSACQVTSSTCEVTEGQRVSISCSAVSNPAPNVFTWLHDVSIYSQSPDLNIVRANRTVHNGKYTCTVTTGNLGNGRLPLTSSQQLTLLVKYNPTKSQLSINAHNNITVNEKEIVVFSCLADGRPTPNMELRNGAGIVGSLLPGGDVGLEDRDTWLNYTLTTQCQHTGVYRCTARNSVGEKFSDTAMLYVNCKPRASEGVPDSITEVNFVAARIQLSFQVVAYPVPDNFRFYYLGKDVAGNATTVVDNILSISCRPKDTPYQAVCDITVDNVTEASTGYYTVTVANSFGAVGLMFRLRFGAEAGTGGVTAGPIIGGVVAVVVFVAVVVAVVFFLRRQAALSTSQTKAEQTQNKTSRGSRDANTAADSSNQTEGTIQPSVYECLNTSEVGLASPYAPLQHHINLRQPRNNQTSEYEELRMREVRMSSPYAALQVKGKVDTSKDHVYQNSLGTKTHTYTNMKMNG